MGGYAFSGKRYMTIGVKESIDLSLQIVLWDLVDGLVRRRDFQVDYLQVFNLSPAAVGGRTVQQVVHSQEQPDYSATYRLSLPDPIHQKVYVIDDVDHCTMLLAEEY